MSKTISLRKAKSGVRFKPGVTRGLRAATARPKTYDPATRTFDFVLASEAPCRTHRIDRNWDLVEVDEILPMSGLTNLDHIRQNGAPLLNSHRYWSTDDVLGRIVDARIEGTQLVCRAFLSDRPDVADIARDIETGVLANFSVGFDILQDGLGQIRDGDVPLVTVGRWKVLEGSLVPVPADDTAKIRSAKRASKPKNTKRGASGMTPDELKTLLETGFRSMTDTIVGALTVDDEADGDDLDAEAEAVAEEARAAFLAKRSKGKTPATPAAGERSAQDKATIAGLRAACTKRGLKDEFAALEASGAPIDELRGVLVAGLRTSQVEVDGTAAPASGKRGKLVSFGETSRGKAAK